MNARTIRRALYVGLGIGLVLAFCLVIGNGITLAGLGGGVVEQHFLGLTVVRSVKTLEPDGASSVEMSPTLALLVPLIVPAVAAVLVAWGATAVRRRSEPSRS